MTGVTRKLLLVGIPIVCCIGAVALLIRHISVTEERNRRVACLGNLETLRTAFSNHVVRSGTYPKALDALSPYDLDTKQRLKCLSDRSPSLYDESYSSYLYTPPTNADVPATNGILVQERRGIHRGMGDLKPSCGILYIDGRVEMNDCKPNK